MGAFPYPPRIFYSIYKNWIYSPGYSFYSACNGRKSSENHTPFQSLMGYYDTESLGITGGKNHDLSLGANFYLNSYWGIKLNGSYVWTDKNCTSFYQKDFFLVQTRLQYVF